ncbi:MAG: Na+/H+ antiporter NhaC family protein [Oscillospiraceae bacterium]|nr:Na+/H+ antiporter NhaC family protein [Oscillospiraceae bacterium]
MGRTVKLAVPAILLIAVMVIVLSQFTAASGGGGQSSMYATFWSLVPPLVAIVLALITREVYSSLFVGILVGGLFYADFSPALALEGIIGILIDWNDAAIMLFLVALGILLVLMNKAGGSGAYARWAVKRIKTKRGAQFATIGLGILLFVDDYFNCLTVGNIMMPLTDRHKVSRAKLAYIVDCTAAPICIIAPVSSWAAAVAANISGEAGLNGFTLFVRSIPYNFYALLTILMMVYLTAVKFDFGPMARQEKLAENKGDLFGGLGDEYASVTTEDNRKGKVYDLVLPVLVLIASCIFGLLYTGGLFEGGVGIYEAFGDCDAPVGLAMGSLIALIFTFLLYIPRKVISFKQFTDSLPEGFRRMVPALLILTLAWTLAGLCRDGLGAKGFVEGTLGSNPQFGILLPAIFFLIAMGVSFSTGTSWGTFAILIPIVVSIFPESSELILVGIAACLAGAVFGDHVSPISDTTIMSATGAQCNLILHVTTQMPYALLAAAVSFVGFVLAGVIQSAWVVLPICAALLLAVLVVIKLKTEKPKA